MLALQAIATLNSRWNKGYCIGNGQRLAVVDKFVCFGGTLWRSANIDEEVAYRIARASTAFGRLKDNVWERRGLNLDTKLKVYSAVVLPSLLYACETWTVYSRHAKQLNEFHMRCLRTLLRLTWRDRVPDTEVLQRAKMESIHAILMHSQLRWAGHVHRMDDCRLPKRLLYGELSTGKRSLGRPKLRYKETLNASLKQCGTPYTTWEESAEDRPSWRFLVKSGVATFEERRIRDKEKKRQRRKDTENSSSQPGSAPHIPCPHCNRLFPGEDRPDQPSPHTPHPTVIWSLGHLRSRRTNIYLINSAHSHSPILLSIQAEAGFLSMNQPGVQHYYHVCLPPPSSFSFANFCQYPVLHPVEKNVEQSFLSMGTIPWQKWGLIIPQSSLGSVHLSTTIIRLSCPTETNPNFSFSFPEVVLYLLEKAPPRLTHALKLILRT